MLLDETSRSYLAFSPKATPTSGFHSLRYSCECLSSSFDFSKKSVKKSKRSLNLAGDPTL